MHKLTDLRDYRHNQWFYILPNHVCQQHHRPCNAVNLVRICPGAIFFPKSTSLILVIYSQGAQYVFSIPGFGGTVARSYWCK